MANQYTFFSTGKIRVGDPGASLSDSNNLIDVQNVTFSFVTSTAEVRTAVHINMYPTGDAQYDAVVSLDFDIVGFAESLIPYIQGVSGSSGGGKNTYTGTLTAKPAYMQLVFIGQDQNGKVCTITLGRVKVLANSPAFGRTNFQTANYKAMSYPDTGGTYAPYVIAIDQ